ncbi:MAG: glycosyltransferase family 2 protein [Sulfitobacter sp.]
MTDVPTLSVCIPAYEMAGKGAAYLEATFATLAKQTLVNFDVVVSDQSSDAHIEALCQSWQSKLDIKHIWFKDGPRQASANVNNAMRHATAPLIKILFQDDLMIGNAGLQRMTDAFADPSVGWVLCGSGVTQDGVTIERPMVPRLTPKLHYGKNTVSSPSVLALRRDVGLMFDEDLQWLMDVAFYKELWMKLGAPAIVPETLVLNRLHVDQVSAKITPALRRKEIAYAREKFGSQDSIAARIEYYRQMIKAR